MLIGDYNQIPVVCSCGRQTILVWIQMSVDGNGVYKPQDVAFQYDESRGWNCGLERHRQSSLAGISEDEVKKVQRMTEERGNIEH
jgi:hypothetical protein